MQAITGEHAGMPANITGNFVSAIGLDHVTHIPVASQMSNTLAAASACCCSTCGHTTLGCLTHATGAGGKGTAELQHMLPTYHLLVIGH
jgi:hypothetical protein